MKEYISLDGISFGYKKTSFRIEDVSLKLYCGETLIITGNNGSGKTTLSKLMMGILKADNGLIFIDGQNSDRLRLPEMAKRIGYLFQNPDRQLFCTSSLEEIRFSLRQKGMNENAATEKARELLQYFTLQDKADEYPLKLSRGEKQRLALLSVFAMQPKYYILDEPSSGIDRDNIEKLIDMLCEFKRQGAGLCLITHEKYLIQRMADRIITMAHGRIINDEKA